jgi:glycosyltransferase involved in cell wall biosynthesis
VISVAVCTRDRANMLARCLTAMAGMAVPPGVAWEIVVVDNGSGDDTRSVAAAFRDRLPIRAVSEAEPGLSRARNRAIDSARGRYIAWTDDDALVDRDWLAAYAAATVRWPEAALFGGPIVPELEGTPPAWLPASLARVAPVLGARDLGGEPVALAVEGNLLPFGGNFMTRSRDHARFRFDPRLGRHPAHPGRGSEETDLLSRMLDAGLTGWWVPGARVRHLVPGARLTTRFLRQHWTEYGEYLARAGGGHRRPAWRSWARVALAELAYVMSRLTQPPDRWIERLLRASEARGALRARSGGTARAAARSRDVS